MVVLEIPRNSWSILHPSTLCHLGRSASQRQQAKKSSVRTLVPGFLLQLLLESPEAFPGQVNSPLPVWGMEASRIKFMLRAIYDMLPSPQNLCKWTSEDPPCVSRFGRFCQGVKQACLKGRYTGWHNQVLKCPASAPESECFESKLTGCKRETRWDFVCSWGWKSQTASNFEQGS